MCLDFGDGVYDSIISATFVIVNIFKLHTNVWKKIRPCIILSTVLIVSLNFHAFPFSNLFHFKGIVAYVPVLYQDFEPSGWLGFRLVREHPLLVRLVRSRFVVFV